MTRYSVVVSMYGWSAKNHRTNKSLGGAYENTPSKIVAELMRLVTPSDNCICIATTIDVEENNEFNKWFSLSYQP